MDELEAFRADALQQGVSTAEVEAWLGGTRFCLQLDATGEGTPAAQIQGWPTLPTDVSWPVDAQGQPLGFLAAIHCAVLPRLDTPDLVLPRQGHLLFFQSYDELWDDNGPGLPEQVLHVRALGPEQSHLPHYERVDLYPSVRFSRDNTQDPGPSHPLDQLTELARTYWPEAEQPGSDRMRIGGYGDVAHNSPEQTVMYELVAQGLLPSIDSWDDFFRLHAQVQREWLPLAQFGSLEEDCPDTNARFMIRRTDLEQARFDRVISDAEFGG
ncbi:DUF1963 domain-containing protein [Kineosporia sp. NBRC 101731]|uniref:DUF1963 domain-containing protein n=1 Tax=Kineosporia sp. NBRC 101731 TaxID=3032199 RepID=UPI0024A41982|nr:DUF1963 domain-containing protein [Kineosporia sp. NBRC 101731]GLY33935.1 hypothetical protein Kisp02_73000 [Kineosporia sp. NBRC 101731]